MAVQTGAGARPDRCTGATDAMLAWFRSRERDIPWREESDPYRIWVAEVMAQQTRIATMRARYREFTDRFPTVEALAGADVDEVLKAWEGLGYYARARNLHAGARAVMGRHRGRVPRGRADLLALPGIGPYTAGAIRSLAFGVDDPAIDGNARRVLSRLFDLERPTPARLEAAGRELIAARPGQAGALNQALMDLGSEVCTPRSPACEACPVARWCRALANHTVDLRPPPRRGTQPTARKSRAVAIVWRSGEILVGRRPDRGLLGGLWDFPGTEPEAIEPGNASAGPDSGSAALATSLHARWGITAQVRPPAERSDHTFSHFHLSTFAYAAVWVAGDPAPPDGWGALWAAPEDLATLAFPAAVWPILNSRFVIPAGGR